MRTPECFIGIEFMGKKPDKGPKKPNKPLEHIRPPQVENPASKPHRQPGKKPIKKSLWKNCQ